MVKITEFDPSKYLDSPEAIAQYLTEAMETNDPDFIADAIGVVAKAHGMAAIAAEAGLGRESLYKSLGGGAKAEFATILKVIKAMGLQIQVSPSH
jgi:probable addiction module antidote protein